VAAPVEVAAAVIERADGSFLLAQRPAGKVFAGWWEFPGGKVEAGEPAERALARELHEELGIDVVTAYPWITREHSYEHARVRLNFFRVDTWTGEPQARENQRIVWQRLDERMAEPMLPANAPVLASLALPAEYAITDAQAFGVERMLSALRSRLGQGLKLIQVRDKGLANRDAFVRAVTEMARLHGAKVLVNGDTHLTAVQLMSLAKRPEGALAAASCHSRAELAQAMRLGLDFAVLGPVKATASHPGTALLGWDGFAEIARGASIPVYAIGGLRAQDLPAARRAGAHGLAMISGAWAAPGPPG
jgi:8-oxo-dGTP diphosphatase